MEEATTRSTGSIWKCYLVSPSRADVSELIRFHAWPTYADGTFSEGDENHLRLSAVLAYEVLHPRSGPHKCEEVKHAPSTIQRMMSLPIGTQDLYVSWPVTGHPNVLRIRHAVGIGKAGPMPHLDP